MKRMKQMKRIVATVLSLAIVLTGIYWSEKPAEEVQAASEAQASASTEANTDMLSVKVQRQCIGGEWQNAMRFVASVDSLNYRNVGFAIATGDAEEVSYTLNTKENPLPQRIKSTDEGMEYTFSPKVIDTSSTYFVTAKWRAEAGVKYTVRAWVENFDGTKTYGQSRCVTLEDLSTNSYLNMSFEAGENHGITEGADKLKVTYGGSTTTADVIGVKGTTVHARVKGVASGSLPSATKFTFTDNEGTEVGSNIFRNLYTEYSETETTNTADTSWYDVYLEENANENEFVIATNADMYGFMHLMNGTNGTTRQTFEGKTVYLVSDIAMNDVKAGETAAAWAQADVDGTSLTTTPYNWVTDCASGTASTHFAGTFDGQMHTLSGVYVKNEKQYAGLFGITAKTSVVKNFYLEESYFTSDYNKSSTSNVDLYLGSVAGRCQGTVENVYSNAIVQATQEKGRKLGGIVGDLYTKSADAPATIDNCWFEGKVYLKYTQGGGIVGYVHADDKDYEAVIRNSLYTGELSPLDSKKPYIIGGIVGYTQKATCNIEDCLSAGTVQTASTDKQKGSIFGRALDVSTYNLVNAYGITTSDVPISGSVEGATTDTETGAVTEEASVAKNPGHGFSEISKLQGIAAYQNTLLDFEDVWCARKEAVPALQIFRNKTDGMITDFTSYEQNNWYDTNQDLYDAEVEANETSDIKYNTKYRIHSLSAFEAFRNYVNAGRTFKDLEVYLATDINMNPGWEAAINAETGALADVPSNTWEPIGTENAKSFKGTFDGQGHTISGVYVDGTNRAGLFGYLGNPAEISDLQIVNSYLKCTSGYAGSVAADWYGGTISNIYSDAYIVGDITAKYEAGGLVGRLGGDTAEKTIKTCWYDGTIMQTSTSTCTGRALLGGFVGYNFGQGRVIIQDSLNTGNIKNNATGVYSYLGGFMGQTGAKATVTSDVDIVRCLNLGNLTSSHKSTNVAPAVAYVNGIATVDINDSLWLKIASLNAGKIGEICGSVNSNATVTPDNALEYNDLAALCTARTSQADEAKYLGFVGLAEEGVTPAFLYMNVNGTTTGMNNVVQSEDTAKDCIVLNDFKDWWLEHHDLTEDVFNVLMIGNSFSSYYSEELYGLAEAAGINMAVYNVYYSGCPVWQYRASLDADNAGLDTYTLTNPITGGKTTNNVAEYEFYVTENSDGKKAINNSDVSNVTLNYCLDYAEWDAVSLQSGRQQGYTDYATIEKMNLNDAEYLYNYIGQKSPNARLLWHHAWEYEVGYSKSLSESSASTGNESTQDVPTRENQILRHDVNQQLAFAISEANSVDIVPTGDAWELLRADYYPKDVDAAEIKAGLEETDSGLTMTEENVGDYKYLCANPDKYSVTAWKNAAVDETGTEKWAGSTDQINVALSYAEKYGDMYHDGSIGGGQYLNACVWFEVLTGKSCVGNQYLPTYTFVKNSGEIDQTYKMYYDETTATEDGVIRTNYDASVLQSFAHQAVEELEESMVAYQNMQELYEMVEPVVQGAARVTCELDGIHFSRYTEEQEASVDERCTRLEQSEMEYSTAGVRLNFTTNSESLTLSVRTSEGSSRTAFAHDIEVNGELIGSLTGDGYGDFEGTFELGEGTKEVCIYFPWRVCSVLTGLTLDEGSTMEPVTKEKTMIFYGDSITHGVLATTPTKHYTVQLAEALNADWINKGLSSDVFRSDFATYKDSGVYEDPDYIVVAYGTNHLSSKNTLEYEQKRIGGFFENLTATYPDATIFVVTPIWRKTADDTQDTSTYVFENLWAVRDLIKSEIADYENVIAIDGTYLVPHDTSYYSDGLHPNDLGFAEYSKNIIAAIKSALGISE